MFDIYPSKRQPQDVNRRRVLQYLVGGGALVTTGCSVPEEDSGAFNFAIENRRERSFHVAFTLRDDDGEIIIDGAVDLASRSPEEEYTVLDVPDLVPVTDGDEIEARVEVDGETDEQTYEITCTRSENAENNVVFQIRSPGAPTDSETGMEFAGSECRPLPTPPSNASFTSYGAPRDDQRSTRARLAAGTLEESRLDDPNPSGARLGAKREAPRANGDREEP